MSGLAGGTDRQFAKKHREARHHKTESHQSQAGAYPGEQGPLGGKVRARIAQLRFGT
jgi:hypothetical protein